MAQHRIGIGIVNPVPVKDIARHIEPSAACILVEIAQNVGQLQCPAERVGDAVRRFAGVAKNMDRKMADRGRNPGSIKIERC